MALTTSDTPRGRAVEHRRMLLYSSQIIYPFAALLLFSAYYIIFPQVLFLHRKPSLRQVALHQPLPDRLLFLEAIRASSIRCRKKPFCWVKPKNDEPPKIAFLFLTNSNLTFTPLWERFFQSANPSHFNVYVHADPSCKVKVPPSPIFKTQFIPAKKTCRGSPSLIAAERRLLARAIIDDPRNLFFALISQHCVPLHSFSYVYNFLFPDGVSTSAQNAHKSFIEIISNDPNLQNRYKARGEQAMLPEVPFEKFRVGSQFFVLAKRHALVVLRDRKLWRKFKLPCLDLDSCYPEEHYFPTLLSMEDPSGCSGFTLTNVNWTGSFDGHPHLYQPHEVSGDLLHRLRRSNTTRSFMFARKFAPECLSPLMEMAEDVIFRD